MRSKFLLVGLVALAWACNKAPEGRGKMIVQDLYPHHDYLKNVYSESMIRSAAGIAGLDSSFAISGHTEYIFQFKIERNNRSYLEETETKITESLANLNQLATLKGPNKTMTLYANFDEEGMVSNAVFYQTDTSAVQFTEFVGNMPFDVLFKEGMANYNQFGGLLNLDLLQNERNDTINQ